MVSLKSERLGGRSQIVYRATVWAAVSLRNVHERCNNGAITRSRERAINAARCIHV
ncbi:hypothetical protein BSU04_24160 [Caballeronia sordidicola]|uniref:Uncharacterized protein n=1 Tax=Caballeronia sordidicola TaxID=196367 RepID=A0A226WZ35_CABSO|nr:hypothetical protein BSU04_24160 [Caballeronia sordidicola]